METNNKPVIHNPDNLPTVKVGDLHFTQENLKDLSTENYNKLKNSILKHGFTFPLAVWTNKDDDAKWIIDGHQRVRVFQHEQWDVELPYITIPANSIEDATQLLLKITSQYGTITQEGLDTYLAMYELDDSVLDDITFDALQFEIEENDSEIVEDNPPELEETPARSQEGKVYQLGKHRIICGDSTKQKTLEDLMNNETAQLALTDPPYNVDYEGGTGLKIENDNMGDQEFREFLHDAYKVMENGIDKGAPFYIFHASTETYSFIYALNETTLEIKQTLVWVKDKLVLGRQDYQWQHEPIIYGWKQGASHKWYGNYDKTTVIDTQKPLDQLSKKEMAELLKDIYEQTDAIRHDRPARNKEHPTMKPVRLLAKLILNSSKKGDIVLDPFIGSGSTLIACEQTDRICYGMELDPKYVDVVRQRYAKFITNEKEVPDNWQELTPEATV